MAGTDASAQGFGFGRGTILLSFLSLQLMLLAFFIVLVSLSTFDDRRVRSVLGSIQDVFAELPNSEDGDDPRSSADALALEAVRDEVAEVLATALVLDRIERTGTGDVEIEVAADRLFADGTAQLLPGTEAILARVATALEKRPVGYRYEMDVLVGRADARPGTGRLEVERAGALVRGFAAAGALPSGLSAGIERRGGERVRVLLRLLADARPHDRFGAASGRAVQP